MKKPLRLVFVAVLVCAIFGLAGAFLHHYNVQLLNPKGIVAARERDLILFSAALSLVVVIPVFVMTGLFVWRYRESNTQAVYTPNWDHNNAAETVWWLLPTALIVILSIVTWRSTHELDPMKPLASSNQAITIQVVAMQWKWLFIYPQEHIATVNYLEIPKDTPVHFEITSDAPMNSFWIPQLGGQIYAMSGMSTQLNLMASSVGDYRGSSANISGTGFAGMNFITHAATQADYDHWVSLIQTAPTALTTAEYNRLTVPTSNVTATVYNQPADKLYDSIMLKYMAPDMTGMHMGDHS